MSSDRISLKEVIEAKSFSELAYKYVNNISFKIDENDKKYSYNYICASSIYYQIYHHYKRMEYGDQFYEAPTDYCKGQKYCGNNHIDARFHRRVALCATYLVTGKCRWENNCKYLHISENITPSISTPPIPPPIPPPIQLLTTNICEECVTTATTDLNTNPPSSCSQPESYYSPIYIAEYWKELYKTTTENIQFESQMKINNIYSEAQLEIIKIKAEAKNEIDKAKAEAKNFKEQFEAEVRKAVSDREYYREKINYFQKEINKHSREDNNDKKRQRSRYY